MSLGKCRGLACNAHALKLKSHVTCQPEDAVFKSRLRLEKRIIENWQLSINSKPTKDFKVLRISSTKNKRLISLN